MEFPVINVMLTQSQFKAVLKDCAAAESLEGLASTSTVYNCKAWKAEPLPQLFSALRVWLM